jgi:ABC-type glutathione transport system ATPase component
MDTTVTRELTSRESCIKRPTHPAQTRGPGRSARDCRSRGPDGRFGPLVAVDRVSFQISADETFALIGPNGAGKSTVMKVLTTMLSAPASSVSRRTTARSCLSSSRRGCIPA